MADAKGQRESARSAAREGADEQTAGTGPREVTLQLPSLDDVRRGATPERLLWYGGLGTLAALGVIEWPVAAVVGVGTYVAKRMARSEAGGERQQSGE